MHARQLSWGICCLLKLIFGEKSSFLGKRVFVSVILSDHTEEKLRGGEKKMLFSLCFKGKQVSFQKQNQVLKAGLFSMGLYIFLTPWLHQDVQNVRGFLV